MGEEPCDERSPGRSVLQSWQPRALKYIYPQACACDAGIPKRSRNSIYRGRTGDIEMSQYGEGGGCHRRRSWAAQGREAPGASTRGPCVGHRITE